MKTFTLADTILTAKPVDFNLIVDLEDMGVNLDDFRKKPMSMIRAYVSVCAESDTEYAGKLLEKHLIGGGTLKEVMTVFGEEMEKSDFFRALNEGTEKKTSKNQKQA